MEKSEAVTVKVKCGRSREWFSRQSAEAKEMVLNYLRDPRYSHLCPCPMYNGNWGYRSECVKCGNAIKEE